MSTEHGDNELELGPDDILVDGLIKKGVKEGQLEVAIGDGMEFTIHGDLKGKGKKIKTLMNNTKVCYMTNFFSFQPLLTIYFFISFLFFSFTFVHAQMLKQCYRGKPKQINKYYFK